MDYSAQTLALPARADVTINWGLGRGANFDRLTVPHRIRVISKVLPEIMRPGYIAHLSMVPSRVWLGEPVLIVQGTLASYINTDLRLWEAVKASGQDCIAIYNNDDRKGMLFGPERERWGEFNINFFNFLGD